MDLTVRLGVSVPDIPVRYQPLEASLLLPLLRQLQVAVALSVLLVLLMVTGAVIAFALAVQQVVGVFQGLAAMIMQLARMVEGCC